MKNLNENINRLKQIMSYDRSEGLLNEQDSRITSIADKIFKASDGLGTDETLFISAIKDIRNQQDFNQVNELLKSSKYGGHKEGLAYFVNSEIGATSAIEALEITKHFKSIGVKLEGYLQQMRLTLPGNELNQEKYQEGGKERKDLNKKYS
tara:strand:- start:232 stop:684 length:453 start_codon:yes stop_codon:yes gene_type:complete